MNNFPFFFVFSQPFRQPQQTAFVLEAESNGLKKRAPSRGKFLNVSKRRPENKVNSLKIKTYSNAQSFTNLGAIIHGFKFEQRIHLFSRRPSNSNQPPKNRQTSTNLEFWSNNAQEGNFDAQKWRTTNIPRRRRILTTMKRRPRDLLHFRLGKNYWLQTRENELWEE